MKKSFTSFEIGKALNIKRECLRDWITRKFVTAEVPAAGHGTKAIFSQNDVYGVALFRFLIDHHGFSRTVAADYVKDFVKKESNEYKDYKTKYIMFLDNHTAIQWGRGDYKINLETGCPEVMGQPIGLPHKWDAITVVNFEKLRNEVDKALEKI